MLRMFCFGFGYCAEYLSRALMAEEGWKVAATARDKEKRDALRAQGIEAWRLNEEKPLGDPAAALEGATHILLSIPPDDEGDPAFSYAAEIAKIKSLKWIGYLSSTSVYGDRGGSWVDETSLLQPSSKRGSRRAKAEDQWLSLYRDQGLPVHVFRLAGIYGPGRSAIDSVRAGGAAIRRIDKQGQVFSRVHIEDIVNVLRASINAPDPGQIYNVCDDEAVPSHEVLAYACELLGVETPPLTPYAQAELSPMARSFYSDNKRVRNDKIKKNLGVSLLHPDYRSGLRACLDAVREKEGSGRRLSL